jgi:peptidoglycan/LPS O-acetylase OafA/YrhL
MNAAESRVQVTSLNIDIFRAFLAQWVILGHFCAKFLPIPVVPGRLAVWCFFVLSGYLNMISFQRRLENGKWVQAVRAYYISRFWRIYPLLMVSYVTVSLTIGSFRNDDLWVLFPMLYSPAGLQISNGVLWTIIIELQLYLLTPLLFYVANSVKSWHWILLGAVSLLMVVQIPKLHVEWFNNGSFIDDRTMLGNLGFYLFGMAIAAGGERVMNTLPRVQRWLWIILVVLCISFLYRYNFRSTGIQFSRGPYIAVIASFLVLTCMAPLAYKGITVFRFLGYYTYEIYVLHGLCLFLYRQIGLSGAFNAALMWWALPLVAVCLYDMAYKKKYREPGAVMIAKGRSN